MTRRGVALLIAASLLTGGCSLARPTDAVVPSAEGADSSVASAVPPQGTEQADRAELSRGASGARADVPAAVIMAQLARRAERIAKHTPMYPKPSDVDPGTNRALGYQRMLEFGFGAEQWAYLDALWKRESGWNHLAENRSSGAYGIPQSLPGTKMAVVGADWRTNPDTQIQWGLAYIEARYGSPQQAWAHSQKFGWY